MRAGVPCRHFFRALLALIANESSFCVHPRIVNDHWRITYELPSAVHEFVFQQDTSDNSAYTTQVLTPSLSHTESSQCGMFSMGASRAEDSESRRRVALQVREEFVKRCMFAIEPCASTLTDRQWAGVKQLLDSAVTPRLWNPCHFEI